MRKMNYLQGRLGKKTWSCLIYFLVIIVILVSAFPLFWMVSVSFQPRAEIYKTPPTLFSLHPTLVNYTDLFTTSHYLTYFKNSLLVALITTFITLVIVTLGAYSLTRFKYWGREFLGRTILFTYMFPPILLFIPLYISVVKFRLSDTLISLIITYTARTLPFGLWLLRSYFATVPTAMEEAAAIDGANGFQRFYKIVLPLVFPGIISTGMFVFILAWNEYLFALCFISSPDKMTLPVGLSLLQTERGIFLWGQMMAASALTAIPVLVFFVLLQRHLVAGFGGGGVKG